MLVGIDPFSADEPIKVYDNILKNWLWFPSDLSSNAKSIIRHLVDSDLSKRYGNLKAGVKDITGHWWFRHINWDDIKL